MYFIFKMSQILIFALKFVGPFQEKTTQTQSFRRKKSKEKLPQKISKASHHFSFPQKWLQASSKYSTHVRFYYLSFLLKLEIVNYIIVRDFFYLYQYIFATTVNNIEFFVDAVLSDILIL